tara:strand:- start:44281 stop:45078 length:798 start_codon:yes stop_codon:yes gene_type:complete
MSTYVNNLRLEEIGTGERSGTWGTATNTNLELIGEALGYGTEAIPTNATTHDSIVADATADAARSMYIKYTGSLNAPCTVTIGPDTMKRVHIIENATGGSNQNILIKQGSGGGASVTIPSGATKIVYLDGGGSGAIVTDALASVKIDTTGAITASGAAGVITGTTIEATGDTSASDNAAMGYTATAGLILTGDGSSNDVTIRNNAGADVIKLPTGTTDFDIAAHNGSSTGLKLGGTLVTATAAQLNASGNATTTGKAIAMAIVFG